MQTQMPGSLPDYQIDPYRLVEDDLKDIFDDIRLELINNISQEELQPISTYYLDGQGKAVRPMFTILMARAINYHKGRNVLSHSQRQIAMISEMIHTASLLHDDVIDQSDIRRGKPSVNVVWSQNKKLRCVKIRRRIGNAGCETRNYELFVTSAIVMPKRCSIN